MVLAFACRDASICIYYSPPFWNRKVMTTGDSEAGIVKSQLFIVILVAPVKLLEILTFMLIVDVAGLIEVISRID